jgi:hypothetical protein
MNKTTSARPSARGRAMIVLKDVPPTYDWGWFSREDPRMHVQSVDRAHWNKGYKVWLERDGRRVIEPEPGIPAKVWKALDRRILRERGMIEAFWISHMMEKGWLELHVANPIVTLVAYPRLPHHFVRILDLREDIGDPETLAKVTSSEVVFNKEYAVLEIFPKRPEGRRHHIRLESVLWT